MSIVRLFSSDLNGTLVRQHTMSDMIRLYLGNKKFRQAEAIFKRQANGTAAMEEAFALAGPLTKGLTLRQAIEYTKIHMQFVNGFSEFVDTLYHAGIPIVLNSTAYSVTIYVIREQMGRAKIHGHIGNFLKFGEYADANSTVSEGELETLVVRYFSGPGHPRDRLYDKIQATGIVELGIKDEAAKARLILSYAAEHFPGVKPNEIAHMGDSMGDSGAICSIAKAGGLGIAFNYNRALEAFLTEQMSSEDFAGKIVFVEPKSESANLMKVFCLSDNEGLAPLRLPCG